jgi:hypothetical protein
MKRLLSVGAMAAFVAVWASGKERPSLGAQDRGPTGGYQGGEPRTGPASGNSSTLIMKFLSARQAAPAGADRLNDLTVVGETFVPSGKESNVALIGRENGTGDYCKVLVQAGQVKLIQLPHSVTGLNWECGPARGRVGSGPAFDWLTIERDGDGGAIHWTFLVSH